MESTVVQVPLNESEIKPSQSLLKYIALIETDNLKYFGNVSQYPRSVCPACGTKTVSEEFEKLGISYSKCSVCITVYSTYQIPDSKIKDFFKASASREYWFDSIWKQTAATRISKVLTPLAEWIETLMIEHGFQNETAVEYAPVHWGLMESFKKINKKTKYKIAKPCFDMSIAEKYYEINKENIIETNSNDQCAAVVLFDSLNRTTAPEDVISWSRAHLKKGGLCFVTTLLSTGLDLQILGSSSNRWLPPDHLNAWSVEGFTDFAKKAGFEIVEFSTPGVLDIVQLEKAVNENSKVVPDFFKYLFKKRTDPMAKIMLQEFLQRWNLSSLGRIVLKKV